MDVISRPCNRLSPRFLILTFLLALIVIVSSSCGSGGPSSSKLSGNTQVTILASGTGNDQLQQFNIFFTNIALTSQSGKTVSLLSTQAAQGAEFIHINGGTQPLLTVSVPQDVYIAATATNLAYDFVCVTQSPGELNTNTFGDPFGGPDATITLSNPLTITGDNMALSLDLLVSQSETFSACYNPAGHYTWTFTPTFSLTPLALAAQPTNPNNGKVSGMHGEIASVESASTSFVLSLPNLEGPGTADVAANSATVYQGLNGFSGITAGTFLDMDGSVQQDGSLLATRIAVEDASAVNVLTGPLLSVAPSTSTLLMLGREEEGSFFASQSVMGSFPFKFGDASFQISGQLPNQQILPFTPSFNGSNMVPGQNIYLSAPLIPPNGADIEARTITLIPQTIDGTISATSNSGNFAVYTVTLAPYDLFPELAVQPGQNNLITNPDQVEVYTDTNTQMLNSNALTVGNTLRFYGLIFNDNGTLRMDCAQVNDGVSE